MRVVTIFVALALVFTILGMVMHFFPRRDYVRPIELSAGLQPPFNPWGNGVRKVLA